MQVIDRLHAASSAVASFQVKRRSGAPAKSAQRHGRPYFLQLLGGCGCRRYKRAA
jgi:hypothetical protein